MQLLLFIINLLLAAFTLLCYYASGISPEMHWQAGFMALAIPVLLTMQGLFTMWWLLWRRYWFLLCPLLTLGMGYRFIGATVALSWPHEAPQNETLSVLSYNTRIFNIYQPQPNRDFTAPMISWVEEHPADIKCIQEFYHLESSTELNTLKRMRRQGEYDVYFHFTDGTDRLGRAGMAICSRFPIVNKGFLSINKYDYGAIYADVKRGNDTIRVYNIHLQSMSIDETKLVESDVEEFKHASRDTFYRLRRGMVKRAIQITTIMEHIKQCPYPVLLCGDLNELPYSYVYRQLNTQLNNTFEKAGLGTGFTFNGRLFFLRIDNQFYSSGLLPLRFATRRDVPYSDHFPIEASYSLISP